MTMFKIIYLFVLGVFSSISLSSSYGIKRFPSNLMLDFDWPDPKEHIMKIPHEKYCHYYYQLEFNEHFTVRKCPGGSMYDYHTHECREKHIAQCWNLRYGKHAIHDHIHSKWRKHFKCPFPNGNYPDIFDCDKYIVCLDGIPHHKHCSPNHQFDKYRRHCVYVAACANSSDAALVSHMCPYSTGNFADLEDCSKYYECHMSEPTMKTCEKNKLFDEKDRECIDKALVHCKNRPNPYRKITAGISTANFLTTNKFNLPVSSGRLDTNTDDRQAIVSSTQSVETVSFSSLMSSKIIAKPSVTKAKSPTELPTTPKISHPSLSSVNIQQKINKSDTVNKSYISTNQTVSNTQSATSFSSQPTMPSSTTAESTKSNDFSPSKSSANIVHSTSSSHQSTIKQHSTDSPSNVSHLS